MLDKSIFTIRKASFFNVSKSLGEKYDIIFIDPPYNEFESIKILQTIYESNILKESGVIIYEEFYKTKFQTTDKYEITDERKYGDTIIRFMNLIKV